MNAGWRIWLFIRITAGDQVGWSELSDSNTCNESTVAFIRSISNFVVGSDIDKYSILISRLKRRFVQNLGFSSLKPLAGVENALIDLFCKLNKLSAVSLLRGFDSGSFDVYWSHFGTTRVRASEVCCLQRITSINDIMPAIDHCLSLGINTVKSNIIVFPSDADSFVFMPGSGKGYSTKYSSPSERDYCRAIESIADWVEFIIDSSNISVAIDLNFNLFPRHLSQLTSSASWYEFDCYSSLHINDYLSNFPSNVLLVSGENCLTPDSLAPLLQSTLPVISLDPCWLGISSAIRHATLCNHYGKAVTIHNFNGHLSTFISLAFASTLKDLIFFELDLDYVPWKDKIFTNIPEIHNGRIYYDSSKYGWGCDLDLEAAHEFIIS